MAYEIKKGTPLPNINKGRKRVYPFDKMEVGEFILVPIKKSASVWEAIRRFKRVSDAQFATRKVDAETLGVWRIE